MAFFVIANEDGTIGVVEYPERETVELKPGERLIGKAATLDDAERIESAYIDGEEIIWPPRLRAQSNPK